MNHHATTFDAVFDAPLPGAAMAALAHPVAIPDGIWTRMTNDEKRARVTELNNDDVSVLDIARRLETTESAIRGVAFRERIRLQGSAMPGWKSEPPMIPVDDVPAETWSVLAGSAPVGMMENTGCAWPVGEADGRKQMFCGCKRVVGKSYCADHHKMSRR